MYAKARQNTCICFESNILLHCLKPAKVYSAKVTLAPYLADIEKGSGRANLCYSR